MSSISQSLLLDHLPPLKSLPANRQADDPIRIASDNQETLKELWSLIGQLTTRISPEVKLENDIQIKAVENSYYTRKGIVFYINIHEIFSARIRSIYGRKLGLNCHQSAFVIYGLTIPNPKHNLSIAEDPAKDEFILANFKKISLENLQIGDWIKLDYVSEKVGNHSFVYLNQNYCLNAKGALFSSFKIDHLKKVLRIYGFPDNALDPSHQNTHRNYVQIFRRNDLT